MGPSWGLLTTDKLRKLPGSHSCGARLGFTHETLWGGSKATCWLRKTVYINELRRGSWGAGSLAGKWQSPVGRESHTHCLS